MNTLGSFVLELCCGQTNKQTERQTNRWTQKSYPRRVTVFAVSSEVSTGAIPRGPAGPRPPVRILAPVAQ